MKEITGINHVGLRVRDLAIAREFYGRLGFVFVAGPVGPEPAAIVEHPSGVNINFILNAGTAMTENILMDVPDKYPGYTHVALEVSDIGSIQAQLEAEEIPITEGPIQFPGGTSVFIRDPDRNVVEFHEPAGHAQSGSSG